MIGLCKTIAVALLAATATSVAAMTACQNIGGPTRNYTLNVTAGYGSPDGYPRPLLLVNGITPGPIIEATQGETFVVTVNNMLAVQIGMHWHGLHQRGTPESDGVPGLNQYAIPPGGNYTYCFGTESNYGAYWYHVHLRGIYEDGVRGAMLIEPNDTIERPYALISNDAEDISAMRRAEQSPKMLMVNDWFHETSDAIALRMVAKQDSMRPLCANSVLFNGMGRVDCPIDTMGRNSFGCESMMDMVGMMSSESKNKADPIHPMATSRTNVGSPMYDMSSMAMRRGSHPTMTMSAMSLSSLAPSMPSGLMATASPSMMMTSARDHPSTPLETTVVDSCQNTTTSRFVLLLHEESTWNMVHLINAGASQQLALSFDEHDFWVVSADGAFVAPQKVQVINIGIGQRYGIMLRKPKGISKVYTIRASTLTHQNYQGTALLKYSPSNDTESAAEATSSSWVNTNGRPLNSSVQLMDDKKLAPYPAEAVPIPNREIRLEVDQSNPTVWVLQSGQPFASNNAQETPLLFAPRNASGIFRLAKGDVVDVLLQISDDSLDMMAHPIHLHGHYFRVLGSLANSTFPTNVSVLDVASSMSESPVGMALNVNPTAPRRDSAHLPEGGWLAIRFVADNPGVWLLHCHINSHLASGMAVAFIEAAEDFPMFPDSIAKPPAIAPLSVIPELQ